MKLDVMLSPRTRYLNDRPAARAGAARPGAPALRAALGAATALILGAGLCANTQAAAPAYPAPGKPITLIVPFGAGSGTDQQARAFAQALGTEFGAEIVVENKGGASGMIAAQYVAKAPADGYTLMLTTNTTQSADQHLFKKLSYDPVKDFTPITLLSKGYMFLLVNPKSPFKSVSDLVAAARKAPGKLNFGSGSSSSRVAGELLKQMTGTDIVNVPYTSNPKAIVDLLGGQIDFMFADASTALPQMNGGKLRALAVSGTRRLPSAPNVPTVSESGVQGYDMSYWTAVYLPKGASPELTARLNSMFIKASSSPVVKTYYTNTSAEATTTTPDELGQFQLAESKKWGQIIHKAGIKPE